MKMTPRELRYVSRLRWNAAKNAGLVPKIEGQKCADCGGDATEYDHRDYRRYLDVDPVCRPCHAVRGPGYPLPDSEPVEVSWYSGAPPNCYINFQFRLTDEEHEAMRKLAHRDGIKMSAFLSNHINAQAKKRGIPV